MLEMSPVEQQIAKQSVQMGRGLPDRIKNAPKLTQGLALFLQAFFDLDAERSQGMSVGRIPWVSIKTYGEFYTFGYELILDLVHHIRKMDEVYLKYVESKSKKPTK